MRPSPNRDLASFVPAYFGESTGVVLTDPSGLPLVEPVGVGPGAGAGRTGPP